MRADIVQRIVQLENQRFSRMEELKFIHTNVDMNEKVRLEIIRLTSEIITEKMDLKYLSIGEIYE